MAVVRTISLSDELNDELRRRVESVPGGGNMSATVEYLVKLGIAAEKHLDKDKTPQDCAQQQN